MRFLSSTRLSKREPSQQDTPASSFFHNFGANISSSSFLFLTLPRVVTLPATGMLRRRTTNRGTTKKWFSCRILFLLLLSLLFFFSSSPLSPPSSFALAASDLSDLTKSESRRIRDEAKDLFGPRIIKAVQKVTRGYIVTRRMVGSAAAARCVNGVVVGKRCAGTKNSPRHALESRDTIHTARAVFQNETEARFVPVVLLSIYIEKNGSSRGIFI